jgi:hypothetical protein
MLLILKKTIYLHIQVVPLATEPGISLIILTLLKILQRSFNRSTFVGVVKSRRMRWTGHVAHMGEDRGVQRVLVGKPEEKRPLGRPRRRWEDNIKMDFQEGRGGRGDWMELAQDRDRWRALVGTVRDFRVP